MIGVVNDGSAVLSEVTLFGVVGVLLLLLFVDSDGFLFDTDLGKGLRGDVSLNDTYYIESSWGTVRV